MVNTAATSAAPNVRRRRRAEANRRTWTTKEEEVLLEGLKMVIAKGQKCDNGFRGRYMLKLEAFMKKAFPDTDLKANPHIQSRLTTWKRNFASLITILARSGVGFNLNGDFHVNCDKAEEMEILKVDSHASKILHKPWPLLEGWREVFGKDRANGQGAEDVIDTWQELLHENDEGTATNDEDTQLPPGEKITFEGTTSKGKHARVDEEDPSICDSSKFGPFSSVDKKKKKVDGGSSAMCDVLGDIRNDMNARFDCLIKRIGHHVDVAAMRKEEYNLVREVPKLNLNNSFTACDKIIGKVERLEFFMALPQCDRASYVKYVLGLDD